MFPLLLVFGGLVAPIVAVGIENRLAKKKRERERMDRLIELQKEKEDVAEVLMKGH